MRTLTTEELRNVETVIAEAIEDQEGLLNDWEADFVSSTADRLGKYEDRTSFSEKQLETIEKIRKKLNHERS